MTDMYGALRTNIGQARYTKYAGNKRNRITSKKIQSFFGKPLYTFYFENGDIVNVSESDYIAYNVGDYYDYWIVEPIVLTGQNDWIVLPGLTLATIAILVGIGWVNRKDSKGRKGRKKR